MGSKTIEQKDRYKINDDKRAHYHRLIGPHKVFYFARWNTTHSAVSQQWVFRLEQEAFMGFGSFNSEPASLVNETHRLLAQF